MQRETKTTYFTTTVAQLHLHFCTILSLSIAF
jgi:hypothetical protein